MIFGFSWSERPTMLLEHALRLAYISALALYGNLIFRWNFEDLLSILGFIFACMYLELDTICLLSWWMEWYDSSYLPLWNITTLLRNWNIKCYTEWGAVRLIFASILYLIRAKHPILCYIIYPLFDAQCGLKSDESTWAIPQRLVSSFTGHFSSNY